MKEFNGTPLSERLAQGPMVADALESTRAFAEALRRLHDSGVVHGALEPSCVILSESGVSLLHQAAGVLTPYSAPEQVQGKSADARSDIFAFGAILYEMLSGRKAFTGEGEALRAAIVDQEPAPLDGVASGLARLVGRCLAKAPAQRCQRMQNVQMELKLLGVMARRQDRDPELQEQRLQAMLRKEIAQVEERLESANQTARELRADIAALMRRMEAAEGERTADAAAISGAAAVVTQRLDGLDHALAEHRSSIESLGTAVTQSDDLIEHLVDEVDALERAMAGRDKTHNVMAALS